MGITREGMREIDQSSREQAAGWRKNPILGVVMILLIIGPVWCLVLWARGGKTVSYTHAYQCSGCGLTRELPLHPPVDPPLMCEKCGTESLFLQYRCGDCGHLFAWEAPRDPGTLDRSSLPDNERERKKIEKEYEKRAEAHTGFYVPCPKCKGNNVYEEYTDSHKRVMVKNQEYLSDYGKKELTKKYGIVF